MIELQDDFTTPEQSKKLLDLGLPVNSANFYYMIINGKIVNQIEVIHNSDAFFRGCYYLKDYFPCWSAGRLMEILAICCENPMFFIYRTIVLESGMIDYCMRTFANSVKLNIIDFSKLEE